MGELWMTHWPDILVKSSQRFEGLGIQPDTWELDDLLWPERFPLIPIARGLKVYHVNGSEFLFGKTAFHPLSHYFVTVEPK